MSRRIMFRSGPSRPFRLAVLRDPYLGIERASVALDERRDGRPVLVDTRTSQWDSDAHMIEDNLLLTQALELKLGFHELGYAGGSACMELTAGAAGNRVLRDRAFGRLATFIRELGADMIIAEDLGTTRDDISAMALEVGELAFIPPSDAPAEIPGCTARGVVESVAAICRRTLGHEDLSQVRIYIKGFGKVGSRVFHQLYERGADLTVYDIADDRTGSLRVGNDPRIHVLSDLNTPVVADIYVPCAAGGDVSEEFDLRVWAICGSANNQLTSDEVAIRLHDRGIIYVPDWVANVGGILAATMLRDRRSHADLEQGLRWIGTRVETLLRIALERGQSPLEIASQSPPLQKAYEFTLARETEGA